jgi:hypothetical protein
LRGRAAPWYGRSGKKLPSTEHEGDLTPRIAVVRWSARRTAYGRYLVRDHRNQGPGSADDWNLDAEAPVPGKRTLVEASLSPRGPRARMPDPGRVTLTAGLTGPTVFRHAVDGAEPAADAADRVRTAQGSPGRPLPEGLSRRLGGWLGPGADEIRVHDDDRSASAARSLRAEAFTVGRDVHFAGGAYDPDSPRGQRLIAHEAAHAAGSSPSLALPASGELAVSRPGDSHEVHADGFADAFMQQPDGVTRLAPVAQPGVIHRSVDVSATAVADGTEDPAAGARSAARRAPRAAGTQPPGDGQGAELRGDGDAAPPADPAAAAPGAEAGAPPNPAPPAVSAVGERRDAAPAGPAPTRAKPSTDRDDGDKPAALAADKGADLHAKRHAEIADAAKRPAGLALPVAETAAARPVAAEAAPAKAAVAPVPRGAKGAIQFAPVDLRTMLPPLGPMETPDERRATEAAFVARYEDARVHATGSIASFLASGNQQIAALASLKPTQRRQVEGAERKALAAVDAAARSQVAAVRAAVAAAIGRAQGAAASARGQVQGAHGSAVASINSSTQAARTRIQAAFKACGDSITQQETAQHGAVDQRYATAQGQFRAAGNAAGGNAVGMASGMAAGYLSQKINRDDSLLEGNVTDRRCEARAQAARDVGTAYRDGLAEEGGKQADKLVESKPADHNAVTGIATEVRATADKALKECLDNLDETHKESLAGADQARTQFLGQIDSALAGAVSGLNKHGQSQTTAIQGQAAQLKQSIRQQARQALAGIEQGIDGAMTGLRQSLDQLAAGLRGKQVPDPELLDPAVAQASEQLAQQIAKVRQGLTQGAAQAAQSLTAASTQGAQGIQQTGASAAAAAHDIAQSSAGGMAAVGAGAQTALAQMAAGHQKAADGAAKAAEDTFPKVSQALSNAYTDLGAKFEEGAQKNLGLIRDAFNDAVVSDLPAAVRKAADEAASKVEPRWKTVLKILVIIVIVIVIAVVLGPMVVGAVAGAAAALGAGAAAGTIGLLLGGAIVGALTGAVTTLADNAMNGRPLGTDFWKNVGMGAAGGLLGAGAGGLLGKLGPKLAGIGKVGTVAIDVAVDVAVDVVVNVAFGEFSLESLGMGAIMSVFMSGLGSTRAMEGLQGKMTDIGNRAGGTMVPPALRRVDVSAPANDVDVTLPGGAGGDGDGVRAPDTAGGERGGPRTPRGESETAPPRQDTRGGDGGPRQPAPETPRPEAPRADGPRPEADGDGARPEAGARPGGEGVRPDAGARPDGEGARPGEPKPDADGDRDAAPTDRTPEDGADTEAPVLAQPTRTDYSTPVGPGGYTTESIPLVGRGDALGAAAANIQPIPGHIDVVIHGDSNTFIVRTGTSEIELDHRALARYLRSRGVTGDQNIRLISCRTGESPTSIAQNLANKLGVRVIAPSDTVWVHPDGRLSVGRNPDHETGAWNGFEPGNRFEPDVGLPGARPGEPGIDGPRVDEPSTGGPRPANDNQPRVDQPVAADGSGPRSNRPAIDKGYPAKFEVGDKTYDVNDPDCPYYYAQVPGSPGHYTLKRRPGTPEGTPELDVRGVPPDVSIRPSADTRGDTHTFPEDCTPEAALAWLLDPANRSSFGPFHAMLQRLELDGLVPDRMPDVAGRSADDVRHDLKEAFKDDVLAAIVGDLDLEASLLRLNEALAGLNSSDRGGIAEAWCNHWNLPPGSHTQIDLPGLPGERGRRADFVDDDGYVTEMKSGDKALDADSLGQFEAYMHAIETTGRIGPHEVEGAIYVFTSPAGARANEVWIRAQLEAHPNLTVQVYDGQGRPHSFQARDQLEIDAYFNGYFDMEGSLPFFPSGPDPQRPPRRTDGDDDDGNGIADRPRGPDDEPPPGPVAAGRTPRPDDSSGGGAAATPPVDPSTLPAAASRDRMPDALRQHESNGARIEVAGRDTDGNRTFDAVYPDGTRVRLTEEAGPARPGTRGQRPPTAEEVAALRVEMARAREIQNQRCEQLTALVDAAALVEVDRAIAGAGIAATMDYSTLPPTAGMAAPGAAITEIPSVLVIGGRESWRARAESLTQAAADHGATDPLLGGGRIGQTPENWEGPGFSRQPGEFTDDPTLLGRASDVGDAAFMTQFESGMAPYDGSVLRVEVNPNDGTWPSSRPLRLTVASTSHPTGEFHVYASSTDVATGRGAARSLEVGDGGNAQVTPENLEILLGDRRLVYYDQAFRHPSSGDVLVYGGGPTAVWAGGTAAEVGANVTVMGSLYGGGLANRTNLREQVVDGPNAADDLAQIDRDLTDSYFETTRGITQGRYFDRTNIAYTVGRIGSVRPGDPTVPGEAGKIMVLIDGQWRAFDQVAIALGQDPAGGGVDGSGAPRPEGAPGLGQIVGNLQLRMVIVDGRLVALESVDPPGAVRVIGAAIAQSARPWVIPAEQVAFVEMVDAQAAAAPPASRYVPDSIYQIGESVPLANRDRPATDASAPETP